jgi:hypothetical protein
VVARLVPPIGSGCPNETDTVNIRMCEGKRDEEVNKEKLGRKRQDEGEIEIKKSIKRT